MTRTSSRDGIQKRGPGHYRVVIELDRDPNGKRRREHHAIHGTLEEAKRLRARLLADKDRGTLVGRSRQTLGAYLESWLEWKQPRVSPRTYERYCSLIRSGIIPSLGSTPLQHLTAQHLDEFYVASLKEPGQRTGATLSATTIHHRHVVLKMALNRAVEQGLIVRNPADFARPPKGETPKSLKSRLRCLSGAEAARFIAAAKESEDLLPVLIALHTGARLGEILALRWDDLDLDAGIIVIRRTLVEPLKRSKSGTWYSFKPPKSGEARRVNIDALIVDALRRHRTVQKVTRLRCGVAWTGLDLVVAGVSGEPLRPSSVSTRFRALVVEMNRCKRCGGVGIVEESRCPYCDGAGSTHEFDGLRFHDLRHSHASIMLANNVPVLVVSERLGHSTPAFTLARYGHVLPGQQGAAAEAFAAAVSGA